MSDPLTGSYRFVGTEKVTFGTDALASLEAECERLGIERALLIPSPSLTRAIDVHGLVQKASGDRVVAVFDGVQPHVPDVVVVEGARIAREAGVDGLISIGGGSPIDIAKAIVLCLAEDVTTVEELEPFKVRFEYPHTFEVPEIRGPGLPHVAISTTLSAGEFTNITGITDTTRKNKEMYISDTLVARSVIHDPALTVHTPRHLWASTGVRAVDHAVERLCSPHAQPVVDALAFDALRRLATYLPIATADAHDLHAVSQCQAAAWETLFGQTNVPVGLSHAIGHQLGGHCGVPHGITSCVMLPSVLEFNLDETADRQAEIAQIFDAATGTTSTGPGAADAIRRFVASLDLPTTLSEIGLGRDVFDDLARHTMNDRTMGFNPRPITGPADVVGVLERAL